MKSSVKVLTHTTNGIACVEKPVEKIMVGDAIFLTDDLTTVYDVIDIIIPEQFDTPVFICNAFELDG